jgi:hypothetical protein
LRIKKKRSRVKVLAFCMTYRLDKRVVENLVRQTGVEFFDVMFTKDNPHLEEENGQYRNMMLNWQKMEQVARNRGYEKLWIVEADTIPPIDALSKLLEVDGPVVHGFVVSRHAGHWPGLQKARNTAYDWKEILPHMGEVMEIQGAGTGCVLIDKSVFDRYSIDMKGTDYLEMQIDQLFSRWCRDNKVIQKVHLGVHCGHVNPNGDIVWPDNEKGFRVEATGILSDGPPD